MSDQTNVKRYDAQQVSVGADFHTDRYSLSILRQTRKGSAWHLAGLTRKQLRELGRDIAEVLTEAQEAHRVEALDYETNKARRDQLRAEAARSADVERERHSPEAAA